MGHLTPAGTGFEMYRNIKLNYLADPVTAEDMLGDNFLEEKTFGNLIFRS